MHLPLKLAISLPVAVAMIGGMVVGLSSMEGRRLHPIYGTPNGLYLGFFAGIAALLLVLPNLLGALAANRFGSGSPILFLALLAGGIAVGWVIASMALSNLWGVNTKVRPFSDLQVLAVLVADFLLLAGVAWYHGRTPA